MAIVELVRFRVDQRQFALPLPSVERVVRAAAITPLPAAPDTVLGAIDVHGRVVPVLDVRRRFGMPQRELTPEVWFLIAQSSRGVVVLPVDEVLDVVRPVNEDIVALPDLPHAEASDDFPGAVSLEGELVLIHDLDRFLSADESRIVSAAIRDTPAR